MLGAVSSGHRSIADSRLDGERKANSDGTSAVQQKLSSTVNSTNALEKQVIANPAKESSKDPRASVERKNFIEQHVNDSKLRNTGTVFTQEKLESIAKEIKKNTNVLSAEQLTDVITDYLTVKGADLHKYLEPIKALVGLATTTTATAAVQTLPKNYGRVLTGNEKKGLNLFWSTNAGARYINGVTRSYFQNNSDPQSIDLKSAKSAAFKELNSNLGSTTIKMSGTTKRDCYDPVVKLLEQHELEPRQTILLMKASLGEPLKSVVYRGARISNSDIKKDDILQTSGFTAFSPDKHTAREFTKAHFYDAHFKKTTTPVTFITEGGSSVDHGTEIESIFLPKTQFKVTDVYPGKKGSLQIFIKKITFNPEHDAKLI